MHTAGSNIPDDIGSITRYEAVYLSAIKDNHCIRYLSSSTVECAGADGDGIFMRAELSE